MKKSFPKKIVRLNFHIFFIIPTELRYYKWFKNSWIPFIVSQNIWQNLFMTIPILYNEQLLWDIFVTRNLGSEINWLQNNELQYNNLLDYLSTDDDILNKGWIKPHFQSIKINCIIPWAIVHYKCMYYMNMLWILWQLWPFCLVLPIASSITLCLDWLTSIQWRYL